MFGPARRRVQAVMDRRLYRHKYDAARTLEHFAAGLRAETDLDKLRANLTAVVHDTMQPTHVSVWTEQTWDYFALPGQMIPLTRHYGLRADFEAIRKEWRARRRLRQGHPSVAVGGLRKLPTA